MKRFRYLSLLCVVLGCVAAEPTQADRDACVRAGHIPGTQAFDTCLQEALARRFERPAGAEIDDLRTRMGSR